MGSSGSSPGDDFKLKSEGTGHISSGKTCGDSPGSAESGGGGGRMGFRSAGSGVHLIDEGPRSLDR